MHQYRSQNSCVTSHDSVKEMEEESAPEEDLESLWQCIETGNWASLRCTSYKPIRDELCALGKIVLRGTRIVVRQKVKSKSD